MCDRNVHILLCFYWVFPTIMIMKKLVYTLAFIHLTLIGVVIFHGIDSWVHGGFLEKPLSFLSSLNYSVWQYGFFSPDVGKSTEVEIHVLEDGGNVVSYSTLNDFEFFTANSESANRFYGFKVHTAADSVFQDLCARSAAVRLMNIHQQSWRINYIMRSIRYPAMKDYVKGDTVSVVEFYNTEFELN